MVLLDALYINQSGGKVLLEYFIKTLIEKNKVDDYIFILDKRLKSELIKELNSNHVIIIHPSEKERKKVYAELCGKITKVFCFGNVPPPIKIKDKKVYIFFQNALILDNKNTKYGFKSRMLFFLKRLYIKYRNNCTYIWIVQTRFMESLLSQKLHIEKEKIRVLPFYNNAHFEGIKKRLKKNDSQFLYVADGVAQKNHKILLEAWEIIFDNTKLPLTLHLTIPDEYVALVAEIARLQDKGVLIFNHGKCSFDKLKELYEDCNYFIMPSLAESFGLPLVEAAEAGCEVIAAELGYVYEIVKPMAIFDPFDRMNIAKVVTSVYEGTSLSGKTEVKIENKIEELINLFAE